MFLQEHYSVAASVIGYRHKDIFGNQIIITEKVFCFILAKTFLVS